MSHSLDLDITKGNKMTIQELVFRLLKYPVDTVIQTSIEWTEDDISNKSMEGDIERLDISVHGKITLSGPRYY